MHKSLVAAAIAVLLVSTSASAQERARFGTRGSFSVGVERLLGFSYTTDIEFTRIALLSASGVEAAAAPYSIPKLSFDYFAADRLSFGLGAGFATTTNADTLTIFSFNPRVGYAAALTEHVSFWPRGGFSYVHLSDGGSAYLLALTLEAQFVFTPVRHFGILLGPTFDVGFAATGAKLTQIGLQAGMIGWF